MELPYVTDPKLGIGGKLRAIPEHFVVEEIPLYLPLDEGTHLYLNISKVGLTTRYLIDQVERLLKLRRGDVGYAGLKDKHARTTQTISIPLERPTPEAIDAIVAQIKAEIPVEVNWARLHRNKLKTGHLIGNHFQITISGLEQSPAESLASAQTIAATIQRRGIANYFGEQRFGHEGDNAEQGRALLLGERYLRDPWMRRFLISSYQSELCNRYLTLRLNNGLFDKILIGDVAKKHATGGIFTVSDASVDQERFDNREISFTAPLFGYKMNNATDESAILEASVLQEAGLTMDHWRRAKVEGTRRMGRLLIDDLQLAMNDAGLTLSFSLPKGAFATTVLREFMKNESAEEQIGEEESDFE